jgi:hypothetical protein
MPNGGGDYTSFGARIATAKREAEILRRRARGETIVSIAAALHLTERTVIAASGRALAKIVEPNAHDARRLMLHRLESYRQRLNERADAGGNDFAAVMSALFRCEIHEANLLGLGLPTQLILEHSRPAAQSDETTVLRKN